MEIFLLIICIGLLVLMVFLLKREKETKNAAISVLRETVIELDARDPYFNGHSRRVWEFSKELAIKKGLKGKKIYELELAVFISELGKMRIPDNIMTKREKLTDEEYNIIKKHPVVSYKMIEDIKRLKDVAKIVRSHHERFDGNGYPDGILGDTIPLESRIISITDAYDAMTSPRPYRKTFTKEEAIAELEKSKNTQFDPELVDIFKEILTNTK